MKAVIYRRPGAPEDVIEVTDVDAPGEPGEGQLLVRVSRSPIHPGNLLMIPTEPAGKTFPPRELGSEGVGEVLAVGAGVSGFAVGDRVAFFPAWGSWREQILVDAGAAVVVPDEVSDDVASQLFVNPVTAREVLRAVEQVGRGTAGVDGPLVVTAAASSVGSFIIDGALARGLDVIPVVRSDSAAEVVRGHFPGLPVVTTSDDGWRGTLSSAITGRPVPVIIDAHGGPFARELMREFLSPEGTLLVYGDLTGGSTGVETFDFLIQEHGIRGVSIGRWLTRTAEVREGDVRAALATAVTSPHLYAVADVRPFDEVADAVVASRRPGKRGTVLLADPA